MSNSNEKKHNCHVYPIERINNFKEMIDRSCEKYKDHVAYKFKINLGKENQEIIEKTYGRIKEEIEGLSTSFLNLGLDTARKIMYKYKGIKNYCIDFAPIFAIPALFFYSVFLRRDVSHIFVVKFLIYIFLWSLILWF